jgi:hypothetical protein
MSENKVTDPSTAEVQQKLVEQDTGDFRPYSVGRVRVLIRLWEIANMAPERTRNGMSAQVKAISLIIAIEGLIPDRRLASAKNEPASPPAHAGFYKAEWLRKQEEENANSQSAPDKEVTPEQTNVVGSDSPHPTADLTQSAPPSVTDSSPYLSGTSWVPDSRTSFHINKHPFGRRR